MPERLNWNTLLDREQKMPAFIVGSSPSLLDEPLDLLSGHVVFLCNKAWKALEMQLLYKANGICYTGLASWIEHIDEMKKYGLDYIPKFYSDLIWDSNEYKNYAPTKDKVYVYSKRKLQGNNEKGGKSGFIPDYLEEGIGKTGSVTLDMAYLCYFMGYKKIYLLGMDLDYTTNPYFFEANAWDYKVSGPKVQQGQRKGINQAMCKLSESMAVKGVELVNLSRGYKSKYYQELQPHIPKMPIDRLENILSGYVRPKSIGVIHGEFYPLQAEHVELIAKARQYSDKLIISCSQSNMQSVLQALKFVDSTVHVSTVHEALHQLAKQYPKDNIRLFNKDGTFTDYQRNNDGTLLI